MKRSFLGILCCAVVALTFAISAGAAVAQTKTLKMQATWPASLTLYENFTLLRRAGRQAIGRERSRSTRCPPDRSSRPSRCSTRRTRRCSTARTRGPATGSARTRPRSCSPAAPAAPSAWTSSTCMGWMYDGGGIDLYHEFYPEGAQAQRRGVSDPAVRPAGLRLVQAADPEPGRLQGHEVPPDRHGRRGLAGAWACTVVNMPGGEIIPSAQRGVIDCAEWVGGVEDLRLGFQNVWKYHYTPGMHENTTIGELLFNGDVWKALTPQHQEIDQVGGQRDLRPLVGEVAEQNADAIDGDAGQARRADPAHAAGHPDRVPQDLGRDCRRGRRQEPVLQEGARLAARLRRRWWCRPSASTSRRTRSRRTTTCPEKK